MEWVNSLEVEISTGEVELEDEILEEAIEQDKDAVEEDKFEGLSLMEKMAQIDRECAELSGMIDEKQDEYRVDAKYGMI